jgi:hypothetical protein
LSILCTHFFSLSSHIFFSCQGGTRQEQPDQSGTLYKHKNDLLNSTHHFRSTMGQPRPIQRPTRRGAFEMGPSCQFRFRSLFFSAFFSFPSGPGHSNQPPPGNPGQSSFGSLLLKFPPQNTISQPTNTTTNSGAHPAPIDPTTVNPAKILPTANATTINPVAAAIGDPATTAIRPLLPQELPTANNGALHNHPTTPAGATNGTVNPQTTPTTLLGATLINPAAILALPVPAGAILAINPAAVAAGAFQAAKTAVAVAVHGLGLLLVVAAAGAGVEAQAVVEAAGAQKIAPRILKFN